MPMSAYLRDAILNHVFNATAYPSPNATLYLALLKSDPATAINEVDVVVDDTAYARQSASFADVSPSGKVSTDAVILFPAVTQGSGASDYVISHLGLFDALTGGNLLTSTILSAPITRQDTKTLQFDAGALDVTLDLTGA